MSERPIEQCCYCNEPTGKAGPGEDSIYWLDGNIGPLCETCNAALRQEILSDMGGLPLSPEVEAVVSTGLLWEHIVGYGKDCPRRPRRGTGGGVSMGMRCWAFLALVWRPCCGPLPGESPWPWWWGRLTIRQAWHLEDAARFVREECG